jgi:hypothetical protein
VKTPKVGIVGYDIVGKVHQDAFNAANIETVIYDKSNGHYSGSNRVEAVNCCDLVFRSVPTPSKPDGACNGVAVEEEVHWVSKPMCIKFNDSAGTTEE